MAFNPRWTVSSKRPGIPLRLVAALAALAAMLWAFPAQAEPALIIEDGVGKVTVDGAEMHFVMGQAYDPDDEYPDDADFKSVRDTSVHDDRGTFLAVVETFEKQCRSDPYPMNVDFEKFKKLKADWLKKRATATNYKKATREFKSNHDFDGRSYCGEVNPYVMELKIFKHLPDDDWSKYEAEAPAWMRAEVSGTYPHVDQAKFTAYRDRQVHSFCSAPKIDRDNLRLVRESRLDRANAEQTKDNSHYGALILQAKQRIEWNQPRDGDIAHLARVCREYGAMVSSVNGNAAPAENMPMGTITSLYLVGVALRDVQCSAGAAVVRNALEFARQNGKTEDDVRSYANANREGQIRALTPSVEWSRNAGVMDWRLSEFCQNAIRFDRFLGLPNRH